MRSTPWFDHPEAAAVGDDPRTFRGRVATAGRALNAGTDEALLAFLRGDDAGPCPCGDPADCGACG